MPSDAKKRDAARKKDAAKKRNQNSKITTVTSKDVEKTNGMTNGKDVVELTEDGKCSGNF